MFKKKRGIVAVQFNWIFVLIVGALIILFFIVMVKRQGDISEEKSQIDIRSKFKTILVSAKQSTGTLFSMYLPKTELEFGCNGFSVAGTSSVDLGEVFAPDLIKSSKNMIYLWALDWNIPYKVSSFVYLTSPDVRYIIVGDNEAEARALYHMLPDNVTKGYLPVDASPDPIVVNNLNNYKVRFIFFNPVTGSRLQTTFPKTKNSDITALYIDSDGACSSPDAFDGCGEVTYYVSNGNTFSDSVEGYGKTYYLKKELLFGAIFSENKELYECTLQKALVSAKIVSEIYQNRTEYLYMHFTPAPTNPATGRCPIYFEYGYSDPPRGAVKRIIDIWDVADSGVFANLKYIHTAAYQSGGGLESLNRYFQSNSCPVVY